MADAGAIGTGPIDLSAWSAVFCDLDGCLIAGDRVLDGACELVAALGDRLWIVSNNSTDTEASLAARLAALGLPVRADRIVLAGVETLRHAAAIFGGRAATVHAAPPLKALAQTLGLRDGGDAPAVAILARDPGFGLDSLAALARTVRSGGALIVSNLDTSHPGPDGAPVPETGACLAALRAMLPDLAFRAVGKPAPHLFEVALKRAGVPREAVLFIGDNPDTDGAGAAAAGIAFRLVAPGAGVAALFGGA
jgi:HAD superfamily hydrolase (TIGR01450 family)